MTYFLVQSPYPIFNDEDGTPLESGYIYIGEANQNPITNPITVTWDENGIYPAAQPIRTIAGYPDRNGSPSKIYVNAGSFEDYSILIQDNTGQQIFFEPSIVSSSSNLGSVNVDTIDDLRSITGFDKSLYVRSHSDIGDFGQGTFEYFDSSIAGTYSDDNGITIVPTGGDGSGAWIRQYDDTISASFFGAVGDGTTDNSTAFGNLTNYLAAKKGGKVIIHEGVYLSTTPLTITGYGSSLRANGKVIIKNNTNEIIRINSHGDNLEQIDLTADLLTGDNELTLASVDGIEVGDMVLLIAGSSTNSTPPANIIPLYKQWFTVAYISGLTLGFSENSFYDFTVTGGDDTAQIIYAGEDSSLAVGVRIEGITFENDSSTSTAYAHRITYSYGATITNCNFNLYSAFGFTAFSDRTTYQSLKVVGYSGFSSARGSSNVTIDNCSVSMRYTSDQNISVFIEETTEKILINNCLLEGRVSFSSSSDATPEKTVIVCNTKIFGTESFALSVVGSYGKILLNNCIFDCPGAVGTTTIKAIIQLAFFDYISIINCRSVNADADSYFAAASNYGSVEKYFSENDYGNTLGFDSSLDYSKLVDYEEDIGEIKYLGSTDAATMIRLNTTDAPARRPLYLRVQGIDINGYVGSIGFNGYVSAYASTFLDDRDYNSYSAWGITTRNNTNALITNDYFNIAYTDALGNKYRHLRVDNAGIVFPGQDALQDSGQSSQRWADTYSVNFRPGTGTPIWTSGAGTPEGVVTAVVGSLYTRTDGGVGTTLYVKETGTGNTGWAAK